MILSGGITDDSRCNFIKKNLNIIVRIYVCVCVYS